MGKEDRVDDSKRKRIQHNGENWYFTITDKSIMASFPNDAAYENKDMKALLNFSCRLASKLMNGKKMSWEDVANQAERSGVGHPVITNDIAKIIREEYVKAK